MSPLFPEESILHRRMRLVACLMSDFAWRENSSYRAAQAFEQVLRAPIVGIDHWGRAFIGVAIHARYNGLANESDTVLALRLIDDTDAKRAKLIGVCLRLGLTLSGGAASVLSRTQLKIVDGVVTLSMYKEDEHLYTELIERRLASVAHCLGLSSRFEFLEA